MRSHTKDNFPDDMEVHKEIDSHIDLRDALKNQELLMSILDKA